MWAARTGGRLSRLDPNDGHELAAIAVPLETRGIEIADEQVWLLGYDDQQHLVLAQVDPATNQLVASIIVGESVRLMEFYDLAIGGGYAWVRSRQATIVKVDLATNTVVARYGNEGQGGIDFHDDVIWVVDSSEAKLYRIPVS